MTVLTAGDEFTRTELASTTTASPIGETSSVRCSTASSFTLEHDVGHLQRGEPVMLRGELIASRRKPGQHELPAFGRLGLALEPRGGIDDHDFDAAHDAAAFVDDTPGKRGGGGCRAALAISRRAVDTRG